MKKSNGKVGYNNSEQYRKLLNWIGDPLLILDKQTLNVLDCNQAAERVYGYTPDEWKARTLFDLHPSEDQARVKQFVEKKTTETTPPFTHLTKDGRRLDVELAIDKAEHQGRPAWIVIMRDCNGHEQIKAELEKARTVAVESARLKSEFLRNVGHEIRTPLNGILGMTELTLSTDLTVEQREYLGMVKSAAHTMMSLMTDILDFSLLEAGTLHILEKNFYLRESLDTLMKRQASRAREKALAITCHVAPDVLDELVGDPRRLCQVAAALLDNAIKFTEQGEVNMRVETEESSEQEVSLHFSISDTGIGIPADRQAMIFEAFTQLDGSATRKYNGTGLGLTLSSRLVELMGGRIWVESEAGQGSTFHFTVTLGMQSNQYADQFLPNCPGDSLPVLMDSETQHC